MTGREAVPVRDELGPGGLRAGRRSGRGRVPGLLSLVVLARGRGREDRGEGECHLLSASDHQLTPGMSYDRQSC